MAVTGGRDGRHLGGAAGLHARRHRLAEPAAYIPPATRRVGVRSLCESAAGICDSIPAWASAGDLPDDIDALKAALLAANDRAAQVTAELAIAKAKASDDQALIAHQQLQIAKLTRELYGQRSERSARLLDQMDWP